MYVFCCQPKRWTASGLEGEGEEEREREREGERGRERRKKMIV